MKEELRHVEELKKVKNNQDRWKQYVPAVSYSESKSTEFRMNEGEQSSTNSPFKLSYANSGVLKLQDEKNRKSRKKEVIY